MKDTPKGKQIQQVRLCFGLMKLFLSNWRMCRNFWHFSQRLWLRPRLLESEVKEYSPNDPARVATYIQGMGDCRVKKAH